MCRAGRREQGAKARTAASAWLTYRVRGRALALRRAQAERPMREMALECLCRMLWVYLYHWKEPDKVKQRIDQLCKILFPDSKRVVPQEVALDYIVALVHNIAMWNVEYGMTELVMPLISLEGTLRSLATDSSVYVERMSIAVGGTDRARARPAAVPASLANAGPAAPRGAACVGWFRLTLAFQHITADVDADRRRPPFHVAVPAPAVTPSGVAHRSLGPGSSCA